mgnify:CR=1 FL=1
MLMCTRQKERYDLRENRKFTMQFMILYVQP